MANEVEESENRLLNDGLLLRYRNCVLLEPGPTEYSFLGEVLSSAWYGNDGFESNFEHWTLGEPEAVFPESRYDELEIDLDGITVINFDSAQTVENWCAAVSRKFPTLNIGYNWLDFTTKDVGLMWYINGSETVESSVVRYDTQTPK